MGFELERARPLALISQISVDLRGAAMEVEEAFC